MTKQITLQETWQLMFLNLYFKFIKWTRLPSVIHVACIWEKKNSSRIFEVKHVEGECFIVITPHSGPTDHLIP
jgi:hypothetical protein